MPSPVLSNRVLNRATLARQLQLERSPMPVLDAVEHLVGLQAQEPLNPYTGLWSRLQAFEPGSLATLLEQRKVVDEARDRIRRGGSSPLPALSRGQG
jgi:DNA glycosylase AlkZ-like